LAKQEKGAQEQLAEAEVRHAVGEYDEQKWRAVNAEFLQTLVRIREELKNAEEEIAKLQDVVDGMSAAETAAKSAPVNEDDEEVPPMPVAPPPVRKPEPRKAKPVDELAFLKSVTEDDQHGPSAGRASGALRAVEPAAPTPPPPEPARLKTDIGARGVAPVDTGGQAKNLAATMNKSLKCKDCGTLNLPTEWYCEQCGAELSAL
jgi:hypothetical protein